MRAATNPFPQLKDARIAIVLTSFDLGGAERQALHLASYLQDTCRARVAVVGLFGGTGDQPVRQMCVQRRLPCLRVNMPVHTNGVPTFRSIRQFARDVASLQPDILLPYTTLPNVLCGIVWRQIGAKTCIWNQRDEGRELAINRWHDLALKNVSHFISNSRDGMEYLTSQRGVHPGKVDLILNGVELPHPKQTRDAVRQNLSLPSSAFVAVMLANIHQFKDHATLVLAWKCVCARLTNINPILILAGREDDSGATRNLIASLNLQQHIRLIGAVADVSSLLHAVDLSVFSSRHEGTPNAVLECMAAGRAVVATDIAGCRDALGEDYAGLVGRGDAQAMAEMIIHFAEDANRRSEVGVRLAARADDQFQIGKMCQRSCELMLRASGL